MTRGRLAAVVAAAVLVISACTTVPTSSTPEAVKTFPNGGQVVPTNVTPPPDAGPREIVSFFLNYNASDDPGHAAARSALTAAEANRWSDATTTIVDSAVPGNPYRDTVTVTGRAIGNLDDQGGYTPNLKGDGTGAGGLPVTVTYGMKHEKDGWRINSIQPNVVLISAGQFQQHYREHDVYFLDVPLRHLVPVPHYSTLSDPRALALWLVARLAEGPPQPLTTGLTGLTDPSRVKATFPAEAGGTTIDVDVPGARQLDAPSLDTLAAQLGRTLGQVSTIERIEITDGGRPLRIPAAGYGTSFTPDGVEGVLPDPVTSGALYYLNSGAAYEGVGTTARRLPGKVGSGYYDLTSIAVTARPTSPGGVLVAGVIGSNSNETLEVGTSAELHPTKMVGQLSRPAWAPGVDEVWIGDGSELKRVSAAGVVHSVSVDFAVGKAGGTISAVRLSPEGARIALVITSNGTSQIYVGTVVRSGRTVRVAGLKPISPLGIYVTDVAWYDGIKLFAIGSNPVTGDYGSAEVLCDGSQWVLKQPVNLPGPPDTLTVSANSVAVVSVGLSLWRQQGAAWVGLLGDYTPGIDPVYIQ